MTRASEHVRVRRLGSEGPSVLLLPGLGARGAGFERLARHLEARCRPILIEYPEGPHAALGAQALAGQVHAAVGPVDAVIASSFGGMVAAQLAHDGQTRGIAFIGSFTRLEHIGLHGPLIPLMGAIAELGRPGKAAAAIAANRIVEEALVPDIVPTTFLDRRSVTHRSRAIPREPELPPLTDSTVSCVVIHGDSDWLVPASAVGRLLKALPPGTPAHLIAGAGHVPYFTHPEVVARIVLPWIESLSSTEESRAAS